MAEASTYCPAPLSQRKQYSMPCTVYFLPTVQEEPHLPVRVNYILTNKALFPFVHSSVLAIQASTPWIEALFKPTK